MQTSLLSRQAPLPCPSGRSILCCAHQKLTTAFPNGTDAGQTAGYWKIDKINIATGTNSLTTKFADLYVVDYDSDAGDLLVSSGLGGRYPRGYPVATVTSVENIPGKSFAAVKAAPSAQLDRSRHLLLVFSKAAGKVPPSELWSEQ